MPDAYTIFLTASTFVSLSLVQIAKKLGSVEAVKNIVYASGTYRALSWSRVYSAEEYKQIYEYGHDVMSAYISAAAASEE